MNEFTYSLLGDGSSDKRLLPLITWLLRTHLPDCAIQPQWADLSRLPKRPINLAERIESTLDLYPCDILFIHRDAEGQSHSTREDEIRDAQLQVAACADIQVVYAIPVRMQEAWLLCDEKAIRRAVGNPNGRDNLDIPHSNKWESLPDPKEVLYKCIRSASGLNNHRRRKIPVAQYAYRVADEIESFSPLRVLPSFERLETSLLKAIKCKLQTVNDN